MLVSGRSGGGLLGEGRYLTAGEAAAELGVSLPTLYSYVSRGMVRSEAAEGRRRSRRYRAEDVRALKERKERRRDPERVAEGALRWGAPLLEAGITPGDGGRLLQRGRGAGGGGGSGSGGPRGRCGGERRCSSQASRSWTGGGCSTGAGTSRGWR